MFVIKYFSLTLLGIVLGLYGSIMLNVLIDRFVLKKGKK